MALPGREAPPESVEHAFAIRKRQLRRFNNGMLDLTPFGNYIAIGHKNSSESPLLRLPGEIRDLIWRYTLGSKTFVFSETPDSFDPDSDIGAMYPTMYTEKAPGTNFHEARGTLTADHFSLAEYSADGKKIKWTANPISLLIVCRQTYLEAWPFAIALSQFHCYHLEHFDWCKKRFHFGWQLEAITSLSVGVNEFNSTTRASERSLYMLRECTGLKTITVVPTVWVPWYSKGSMKMAKKNARKLSRLIETAFGWRVKVVVDNSILLKEEPSIEKSQ